MNTNENKHTTKENDNLYDLMNVMYYYALRNDFASVNQLKEFAMTINYNRYHEEKLFYNIEQTILSISSSVLPSMVKMRPEFLEDTDKRLKELYKIFQKENKKEKIL